jgi:hypothetical protein
MGAQFTSSDAKRFTGEARRVIAMARLLGWSVNWGGISHKMVTMHSPDHTHRINVPVTNVNHNRARSWIMQILRHTPTANITAVMEGGNGLDMMAEPDMAEAAALVGASLVTFAEKQAQREKNTEMATVPTGPATDRATRTVKSEAPYMAKHNKKHTRVESGSVLVRTWSDGTVDYKCRMCEAYTSDRVQSVVIHATQKHIAPENKRKAKAAAATKTVKVGPAVVPVDVVDAPDARWMPPGNMPTMAEALDAFVALAPRMREIAESIRALEADRDLAVARAEKAEGDLDALRDLLNVGRSA